MATVCRLLHTASLPAPEAMSPEPSPPISIPVPPGTPATRLDIFLARTLPQGSRRAAQRAVAAGDVRVNGRRPRKGTTVRGGDLITLAGTVSHPPALQPNAQLHIPILYEDTAVIVLDKPPGIPSHALRGTETATVANFLVAHDAQLRTVGRGDLEAGTVHRLDTETSGVLLAARTPAAYRALRGQFDRQEVGKEYRAVVHGTVIGPGTIDLPIAHDRRRSGRMRIGNARAAEAARPASTAYEPLERYAEYTLLGVRIRTGVMHQIRVHLAAVGHPIVGDRRYGGMAPSGGVARHLLHAFRLRFRHPETGQWIEVTSPLPEDFAAFLKGQVRNAKRRSHP